ncbi:MAG: SDR family NAD(P)-dependent oxidoreductase [Microcoleaceae cyanobacterium]
MINLTGNALVTGASQGIGLGFVQYLLRHPNINKIYATYRSKDSASELLKLEQQFNHKLVCISIDLTQEEQIIAGMDRIKTEVNQLHWVINCVGILHNENLQPEKSLRQINADNLMQYFQTNSISAILLAKHLQPLLKHDKQSIFATISAKIGSIGDNRLGGWYGYRASKAALNMFIKTASIEYRRRVPNNIIVVLHPGTTDTRLSEPFQRNVPPGKLFPVEKTVSQLMAVITQLEAKDSGEFFSWDGTRLPW